MDMFYVPNIDNKAQVDAQLVQKHDGWTVVDMVSSQHINIPTTFDEHFISYHAA